MAATSGADAAAAAVAPPITAAAAAEQRAAAVFCSGPLLDAVQRARLFEDAKHFVDMPLRRDPEEVLAAFEQLSPRARADPRRLRAFVDEFFDPPGAELEPHVPKELLPEPPFVAADMVRDTCLQEFAVALHQYWPALCRVTKPALARSPQRFTALPRRFPIVLPGGRFRETYYWDCLWIADGLLASGLRDLAKGLAQNLLDDVADFGFVPNGGRCYYLNRSQPPVLAAMVADVARALPFKEEAQFLAQALPLLRTEYRWWMESARAVEVDGVKLNRYWAEWRQPRPESYWQDVETSAGSPEVCQEIASAAETGWDFSGRWARPSCAGEGGGDFRLASMRTTAVLPVCLNSILYHAELTLAAISEAVATGRPLATPNSVRASGAAAPCAQYGTAEARAFLRAAQARRAAMDRLLWRADLGRWVDLWLPEEAARAGRCSAEALRDAGALEGPRPPTVADFAPPLWAGLATTEQARACVAALGASGLIGPAGVLTTTVETGEQWDAPNAWAPMQAMLIEGLRTCGVQAGERLALDLAQRWVGTCYAAWRDTGAMHEKYNALAFGRPAGGGEYEPQKGFGWSNAVVLGLLAAYGRDLVAPVHVGTAWALPCCDAEPAPPLLECADRHPHAACSKACSPAAAPADSDSDGLPALPGAVPEEEEREPPAPPAAGGGPGAGKRRAASPRPSAAAAAKQHRDSVFEFREPEAQPCRVR